MKLEDWKPYKESSESILDVAGVAFIKAERIEKLIPALLEEISKMNKEIQKLKNKEPIIVYHSLEGPYR